MTRTTIAGLAALWAVGTWAAEGVTPLGVKVGQWEMTHTTVMKGAPPIPAEALAKMSPEVRAQIEQQVKARKEPKTEVKKHCVTKEDLAKAGLLGEDAKGCKRTIVTSTSRKLEVQLDCAHQEMRQSGSYVVEATDPEHVKGSMRMDATGGGNAMTFSGTFSGRYLGAACEKELEKKHQE
jgi:hypothetical protein